MPIMTPKRRSTTVRITQRIMAHLRAATRNAEGIIVRHRGVEYGVVGTVGKWGLRTHEGVGLDARECTTRRTTCEGLELLYSYPRPLAA